MKQNHCLRWNEQNVCQSDISEAETSVNEEIQSHGGKKGRTVGKAVLNCEGLVVNAMGCKGRAPLGRSSWNGVAAEFGGWRALCGGEKH